MQKKQKIILIITCLLLLVGFFFALFLIMGGGKTLSITGDKESLLGNQTFKKSSFSGMPCENPETRAFSVDLAQYPETMPLSSISQAEIVIEGPVANPKGITRLLAIYQCQSPEEIGSIRSVRPYMADLALGFDTIFSSWGGSTAAIQRIKNLGLDWLDSRVNPAGAFFRKKNVPAPHNGFTSLERLKIAAQSLNMREVNQFSGYMFFEEEEVNFSKKDQNLKINYAYPVEYKYDPKTGNYLRFWNDRPMIDRNTSKQVWAGNVVVMKTKIGVLSAGVVDVKVVGTGQATIYQAGEKIEGIWQKEDSRARLAFFDEEGKEIKFIPGPIWIEITQ
ncbi:MAG: DUF3048 domain-containing protein [Candidatus Bathyarchaeota archaeon]|nr:DUF3048 domain-containing protein [Candidatus Bathyarchaeota archaeon]